MPMNKVIICGYLGQEPDLKYFANGNAYCNLSVSTPETWKDKNSGKKMEKTEWHRVVVYGTTAEACNSYLTKGQQILIEGKLQTRSWEDKSGKKNYMTEILANNVQFLGKSAKNGTQQSNRDPKQGNTQGQSHSGYSNGAEEYASSDIPF